MVAALSADHKYLILSVVNATENPQEFNLTVPGAFTIRIHHDYFDVRRRAGGDGKDDSLIGQDMARQGRQKKEAQHNRSYFSHDRNDRIPLAGS